MDTLTRKVADVKCYEAELAVLDAELTAAQLADDPSRWLAAWNAREELQVARFLAEYPPCPDDKTDATPKDEGDAVDWPGELGHFYNTWYALGYDCVTMQPAEDLGAFRLFVARLAYDRGWKKGLEDRYTWLDELDWAYLEAEEAEVRSILGHPAWDWDEDDVVGRDGR